MFGRDVAARDVLYLALEDTLRRLQDRIRKQLAPGEAPPARLHLFAKGEWPPMHKGGLDQLTRWLAEHPTYGLVMIDTYAKFKRDRARLRTPNGTHELLPRPPEQGTEIVE